MGAINKVHENVAVVNHTWNLELSVPLWESGKTENRFTFRGIRLVSGTKILVSSITTNRLSLPKESLLSTNPKIKFVETDTSTVLPAAKLLISNKVPASGFENQSCSEAVFKHFTTLSKNSIH